MHESDMRIGAFVTTTVRAPIVSPARIVDVRLDANGRSIALLGYPNGMRGRAWWEAHELRLLTAEERKATQWDNAPNQERPMADDSERPNSERERVILDGRDAGWPVEWNIEAIANPRSNTRLTITLDLDPQMANEIAGEQGFYAIEIISVREHERRLSIATRAALDLEIDE